MISCRSANMSRSSDPPPASTTTNPAPFLHRGRVGRAGSCAYLRWAPARTGELRGTASGAATREQQRKRQTPRIRTVSRASVCRTTPTAACWICSNPEQLADHRLASFNGSALKVHVGLFEGWRTESHGRPGSAGFPASDSGSTQRANA